MPNDLPKLKRWLEWVAREGELRACYDASGAGYVLHRALQEWGYACGVIAPSLIPHRPGVQRKHDRRDAADLARYHRAGELVLVRIPSEAEERVRNVVRSRETFQREILKSRHYIARRGFESSYLPRAHWSPTRRKPSSGPSSPRYRSGRHRPTRRPGQLSTTANGSAPSE